MIPEDKACQALAFRIFRYDVRLSAAQEIPPAVRIAITEAERVGFEPTRRLWRLLALQASAFDHLATSPQHT